MAYRPPEDRALQSEYGRIGGHTLWSCVEDRSARMVAAQDNSPLGLRWHAVKLGIPDPDHLTASEVQRCESARKAYFLKLALNARLAKERKRAQQEAEAAAADEAERVKLLRQQVAAAGRGAGFAIDRRQNDVCAFTIRGAAVQMLTFSGERPSHAAVLDLLCRCAQPVAHQHCAVIRRERRGLGGGQRGGEFLPRYGHRANYPRFLMQNVSPDRVVQSGPSNP